MMECTFYGMVGNIPCGARGTGEGPGEVPLSLYPRSIMGIISVRYFENNYIEGLPY
jgi:hypothetical protein